MKDRVHPQSYKTAMRKFPDIIGWEPGVRTEDNRIHPHVTRFIRANGNYVSVFHSKPVYYETRYGTWRPLEEVTTVNGNTRIVIDYHKLDLIHPAYIKWLISRQALFPKGFLGITSPYDRQTFELSDKPHIAGVANIAFTTLVENPDANPETTTVDGGAACDVSTGWTNAHNSGGTTHTDDQVSVGAFGTGAVRHVSGTGGSARYRIDRSIVGFDTSSIGTDAISSGSIDGTSTGAGLALANAHATGTDYIFVTEASPASNTDIVNGDFDAVGDAVDNPVEHSDQMFDLTSANTTQTFTLNSGGRDYINKSGVTNFGFRIADDNTTTAPFSSSDTRNSWVMLAAENGTNIPELTVEHAAAGGVSSNAIFSFGGM